MADSAILAAGGGNAPLTYKVPGAAVIRIKQVHVHYTDNSAGADWLPMVRIVSDSNHTMGQAADQAVKVTAGDDAAVTFHPGVKHAASSAAGKLSPIYGILSLSGNNFADPAYSVAAGGTSNVRFPHQDASNSGAFTFVPSTTYSDTIRLSSLDYLYVCHSSVRWNAVGFDQQAIIIGPSPTLDVTSLFGALDNHGDTPANAFATANGPLGGPFWAVDTKTFVCETVPQDVTLQVLHGSATAKDIGEANLLVIAYKVF